MGFCGLDGHPTERAGDCLHGPAAGRSGLPIGTGPSNENQCWNISWKAVPNEAQSAGVAADEIGSFTVYEPQGCRTCNDRGYKGRVAQYEVMPMTDTLNEMVLQGCSTAELKEQMAVHLLLIVAQAERAAHRAEQAVGELERSAR